MTTTMSDSKCIGIARARKKTTHESFKRIKFVDSCGFFQFNSLINYHVNISEELKRQNQTKQTNERKKKNNNDSDDST